MTRANLSKRAAQLLGPPPDHPIDWDALVLHEPREIKSEPVVRAPLSLSPESPEWMMPTRKRRRTTLPAPRRVTLSPEESPTTTSACEERTRKRRLEKRKRRRGLKQSTIAQSLKLNKESSAV